jgi:hypothetical protein
MRPATAGSSSAGSTLRSMSVTGVPGTTAFTRVPRLPSPSAAVIAPTAALLCLYALSCCRGARNIRQCSHAIRLAALCSIGFCFGECSHRTIHIFSRRRGTSRPGGLRGGGSVGRQALDRGRRLCRRSPSRAGCLRLRGSDVRSGRPVRWDTAARVRGRIDQGSVAGCRGLGGARYGGTSALMLCGDLHFEFCNPILAALCPDRRSDSTRHQQTKAEEVYP